MEYKDIYTALALHEKWLNHESGGKRLIISKKDLSNMVLKGRNFSKCVAILTDFRGADLRNCNFEDAILDQADMSFTNLTGANMKNTSTQGCIMTGANIGIEGMVNRKTIESLLDEEEEEAESSKNKHKAEITEQDLDDIDKLRADRIIESLQIEWDDDEEDEEDC